MAADHMHHFPPFRVDFATATLWRQRERIPLAQKPFALLRCLLQHRGTVVSREVLLDTVWPDAHVHPANVKILIGDLRRALDDDSTNPMYIRSVPRRGYVFTAPVVEAPCEFEDFAPQDGLTRRESELAALTAAFREAARGNRQTMFVVGPPQGGKTTLIEAFLRRLARSTSARATWARGREPMPGEPQASPLPHAIARLARSPSTLMLAQCVERHAPSWLPLWLSADTTMPPPGYDQSPAIYGRLVRELICAIEAATADLPLVIWLDDAERADALSIDVVNRLGRRPDPARLLLIVSAHVEQRSPATHALRGVIADLLAHTGTSLLELLPPGTATEVGARDTVR